MTGLRASLFRLLGIDPVRAAPVSAQAVSEQAFGNSVLRDLRINGLPATFLHPGGRPPVILYCHAHGGDYALGRAEVTVGARWLPSPWAVDLLDAGFAVLCMDMPGFGDRQAEGGESDLAKAGLWQGKPLFGRMIADLQTALDWLGQAEVDASRIAAVGVSMGAAHAFWLAGLDDRIGAVVQICMLADMGPLIAAGQHDRHGLYLIVPGLLSVAEIGDVAGLVAPRPQFVAHGLDDPFTPTAAREPALERLRAAYAALGGHLETLAEAGVAHTETPTMRRAALKFLSDWAHGYAPLAHPGGHA